MVRMLDSVSPAPLDAVLTNRFFLAAGLVGVVPFVLLPLVDRAALGPVRWVAHPVALAVLWGVGSGVVGLQLRVYRAVVREGPPGTLDPASVGRDAVRVFPLVGLCFGLPVALSTGLGVDLLTLWAVTTGGPEGGFGAVGLWQVVCTVMLLCGGYVFPAALGVTADIGSVTEAAVDGRLEAVLRSPSFLAHWLAAVAVALLGMAVLVVWAIISLATHVLFYWFAYVVLLPVGLLLATAFGSVVSYIAASGYAKARDESSLGDERVGN